MNKIKLLELIAFLRSGVKKESKEDALSVALAYAIPVQRVPAENQPQYFASAYPKVCEIVSQINEEHLVKVADVCANVREIYQYRVGGFTQPQLTVPAIVQELETEDMPEILGLIRILGSEF